VRDEDTPFNVEPWMMNQPVGGFMEPVNKLSINPPYLAFFELVSAVPIVVAARHRGRGI